MLLFLFLLTAFAMKDRKDSSAAAFSKIHLVATITKFLNVDEMFSFANCSKKLRNKIKENISRCVWFHLHVPDDISNDFKLLAKLEASCKLFRDSDFGVFAEFEQHLEWVRKSFEIKKRPNGFEVIPVNHYVSFVWHAFLVNPVDDAVICLKYPNLRERVEKLLLYSEQGAAAGHFSYSLRDGRKNLLHYTEIDQHNNEKIIGITPANSLTLGEKQISITPKNIECFFRLCANENREVNRTFLLEYDPKWTKLLYLIMLAPLVAFAFIETGLITDGYTGFILSGILSLFVSFIIFTQYSPVCGRLARFIGRNSANRILVSFGIALLYASYFGFVSSLGWKFKEWEIRILKTCAETGVQSIMCQCLPGAKNFLS